MVFSSLVFLYIFLPLCLAAYFITKNIRVRNVVLLVFSLVFYAWGEPTYIFLMILTTAVDFFAGLFIEKYRGTRKARLFLTLAVVLTLSSLGLFKYFDFFATNANSFFHISVPLLGLSLPIGISFYTFQALTYVVDVYRGKVQVQTQFYKMLLYVSMFPQLIAGPIVRYSDVCKQIDERTCTVQKAARGKTLHVEHDPEMNRRIAGEFGVPTSELRSWYRKGVKLLHPVGDEGFGDVSEDDRDSRKDEEVRGYREGLIRILSKTNPQTECFIVRRPMLVMEGARLLASTVNDGAEPDERIWSEKASRFVLPPLDLYMVEGTVRFGRGYIPVDRADIVPGSNTNTYQRGDDIYGEAGRLVLFLEGNASVTMPILTDYPIELRRKMIV